jgi:hypothetical protein
MTDKEGKGFRGDIEAGFSGHRIKREPAETPAMHDYHIGAVDPPGLVEQQNLCKRDCAKLPVQEPFDKCHVSGESRADIVWLQELDLFWLPATCTALPDQRDIAVIAPEKDLFDGRLAHHTD